MNKGRTGFVNLGNSCYLNAVTQMLLHAPPFIDYFLKGDYQDDLRSHDPKVKINIQLIRKMVLLIREYWRENIVIRPESYRTLVGQLDRRFANYNQQDAHEVMVTLLDGIHNGVCYEGEVVPVEGEPKTMIDHMMVESHKVWTDFYRSNYSKIVQLFYGQFVSALQCTQNECKKRSFRYEPFSDWQLQIPQDSGKTLYDCMNLFCKKEQLDEEDGWKCGHCQQKNRAYKQIRIWRCPQLFIIVLKRFMNDGRKNTNYIDIPIQLDLTPYAFHLDDPKPKHYQIRSIVHHSGTQFGGHYWTTVYENLQWYKFNDESVTICSDELGKQGSTAYILCYERL